MALRYFDNTIRPRPTGFASIRWSVPFSRSPAYGIIGKNKSKQAEKDLEDSHNINRREQVSEGIIKASAEIVIFPHGRHLVTAKSNRIRCALIKPLVKKAQRVRRATQLWGQS